jgi:outer membrane protein OmpA-like peptidoglycan-associated protein/Mg-chelatase subunit ChlD
MKRIHLFLACLALIATHTPATSAQEALEITLPDTVAEYDYQQLEENKILISATDAAGNPVKRLTSDDIRIARQGHAAQILSVQPLETSQEVSLNIIMVVDNSASMRQRKAIKPILAAMEAVYKILRPIDNITVIVFQDDQTVQVGQQGLHVKMLQSNDIGQLRDFLTQSFDAGLTSKTVLYEAMLAGVAEARRMPPEANKFMVVFSDGEDLNSAVKSESVMQAAENIPNFDVYAVDYMPGSGTMPFLQSFAARHGGRVWKATSATDLVPIFEAVSSKLLYRYVVAYRFLYPPAGRVTLEPAVFNIEEITTIDSSPMLNYIYFDTAQSAVPERYVRFRSQGETDSFDPSQLRGAKEKYENVLNIVGQRLRADSNARLRLVGCNANTGEERGRTDLSRGRAEAVKAYLQYIWGVDPARLNVEARNLPEIPSSGRTEEGRVENQRVEIYAEPPAILDVVQSAYVELRSDADYLRVLPAITSEHGLYNWQLEITGDGRKVFSSTGTGAPPAAFDFPQPDFGLADIARYGQLQAILSVEDMEGQPFVAQSDPITVNFIQREVQRANNLGYKVEEKYALILFDYDSAAIKERNAVIVQAIVERIKALPDVKIAVVGHTDNLGKEEYNVALSVKRAKAVYEQILAALGGEARDNLKYSGIGPFDPLYSNSLPENRALNRTVTIALEYQQKD